MHLSTVCPVAKYMSASVLGFFFFERLAGPFSGLLTPFNDAQTVTGSIPTVDIVKWCSF